MEMMLEVMMWVLDMEVDKVAKFLTNAQVALGGPSLVPHPHTAIVVHKDLHLLVHDTTKTHGT